MSAKTVNIIYDGDCGFCARSLQILSVLDVWNRVRFHASQNAKTFAQFPSLRHADVNDAMYAMAVGELPQRGFFAFRRVLWTSPLMWPLLLLFYFPGSSFLGPRIYSLVARNRGNLGCGSDSCALPGGGGSAATQFKE